MEWFACFGRPSNWRDVVGVAGGALGLNLYRLR